MKFRPTTARLPDPVKPSPEVVEAVRKRFPKAGFYAVQNASRTGTVQRICEVDDGLRVRVHGPYWEAVETYFTDYDGNEWEGLIVIHLEGFSS